MSDAFDSLGKFNTQSDEEDSSTGLGSGVQELPAYLRAADNHNIGGSNGVSWSDPSSWVDAPGNTAKFLSSAVVSGVASIYNSGVAAGNFFGADLEEADTKKILTDFDDDLGKYYGDNQDSIDLVGFIGTSLVPGSLGIKALQAAKTGLVGKNIASATNLLTPNTEKFIANAVNELSQSTALFSSLNTNVLKALGSGVGNAVVESLAFEAAVTATMFKSPILAEQDIGDLTSNILIGGALGGAIGGAFNAAKVYGKVKAGLTKVDEELKPVAFKSELPDSFSSSDKIITALYDAERVTGAKIVSERLSEATVSKTRDATLAALKDDIRTETNLLAKGDTELGNTLNDAFTGVGAGKVESSIFGASQVGRVSTKLDAEIAHDVEIAKATKKVKGGTLDLLKEGTNIATQLEPPKLAYVKLHGENSGATTLSKTPKILSLADTVANKSEILAKVDEYKFTPQLTKPLVELGHTGAEARYIYAAKQVIKDGSTIAGDDIPMLEKALITFANRPELEGLAFTLKINSNRGLTEFNNIGDLRNYIIDTKTAIADDLITTGKYSTEEIGKIVNVKQSYLEGKVGNATEDFFARQAANASYTEGQIAKGLWTSAKGEIDTAMIPSYAKISYDTTALDSVDGMVVEGMTVIQQKYASYMQGVDNAVASAIEDDALYAQLFTLADRDILQANRYGAQSGLFSFANAGYDSLGSKVQQLGAVTARLENAFINKTLDALNSKGLALLANPDAAIEFATLNQKISGSAVSYVLQGRNLVPKQLVKFKQNIAAGKKRLTPPEFPAGTELSIGIKTDEALEAVQSHIQVNGARYKKDQALRASQGLEHKVDGDTFYPIRKNPQDYRHFAFVVDEKLTATGHISMIHAATPEALEGLIAKVPAEFSTITKTSSERFHKALGDYDYSRTLNNNYIDVSLRRSGVDSDFFVQTDPQKIVNTWIEDQTRRDRTLAKELVRAKNEKQFKELESMGEAYTDIAASKYASSLTRIADTVKNPYANYIKTALNISSINEHPLLVGFNNVMDKGFSTVARAVGDVFDSLKTPADLEAINQSLEKYGAKSGYYDAATNLLANHTAPRGELTKFVRSVNGMIATLSLRTDPLNALNNAIGSNVLLGAETNFITNAIKQNRPDLVGRLAELGSIKIPGTEQLIKSPQKLIANAYKQFFSEDKEVLLKFYKENGWSSNILEQHRALMEDLTLKGGESVADLTAKTNSAFEKFKMLGDKAEGLSGNRLAEELNRFVSASVAKSFTDLAEQAGIFTKADSLATINTFVNRTQGNILASQRPLIFQGPVGMAVGLFQSYQFNMMQQLFRYVAEGSGKDAAMLLGLQGTLYGMNGLPAFNYINTHIVGTASGNTAHKDLYDATYGVAGKTAGDWLMFGAASNLPKIAGVEGINLYSRGDLNPRQLSIIPINPADIPSINAIGKVFTNLVDTATKITGGANIAETITQAIEHNGFSRPLAGLAQISQAATSDNGGQAYSTDTKGNILGSNDLLQFSSLIRLAGGKPLDEAIVNDRFFTIKAYQSKDKARMDSLVERVKTSTIQGNTLNDDQYEQFSYQYAKIGGKTKNFNKFIMNQYTNANKSGADKLASSLSSPFAQNMQEVMRGREVTATQNFGTEEE